ncbi:MAG: carboxypeptidase-like regulatory domain-containing protein, partial [Cyclobacteriaceae bacterium]
MKQKRLLLNFLLSAMLVLSGQVAFGQGSTTSAMNGLVTDESGEPLIGATVQATHQPSGTTYGNVTNIDGRYVLRNMRVGGPYRVVITYVGFDDVVKDNIFLQLGRTFEQNVIMSEGTTELQEVVISGERG